MGHVQNTKPTQDTMSTRFGASLPQFQSTSECHPSWGPNQILNLRSLIQETCPEFAQEVSDFTPSWGPKIILRVRVRQATCTADFSADKYLECSIPWGSGLNLTGFKRSTRGSNRPTVTAIPFPSKALATDPQTNLEAFLDDLDLDDDVFVVVRDAVVRRERTPEVLWI